MSGIIGGMDYSLLFGSSDTTSSLLGALYGGGSSTAGVFSDPLTALRLAQKNEAKSIANEAKDPTVAREVALFTRGIAKAKDIKTALQDPNVLKVLLTANGLGDQAGFTALAQKALLSDPSDPKSLVNKLSDPRWKITAQTYNFATKGLATLQDPKMQATLAKGYAEVKWRQSLDQANPGLSNAMQFQAQAASITSVDQILGDKVNRDVVLTALSIPPQIAYQTLTAQEHAVASRLDLAKLKDAHFVQTLTQQYLLNKAQMTGSSDLAALAAQAGGRFA